MNSKRFRALFLLAAVFAIVFSFASIRKSTADPPSPSITMPCGIGANGPNLNWTRDCMQIKIIDRAHVEVKIKDGDKLAIPDSASGTTLGERIGGISTLSPSPVTDFSGLALPQLYCAPNLGCHGPIIRLGLRFTPLFIQANTIDGKQAFDAFQMFVGGVSNNGENPNLAQIWGGNVCQGIKTDEMVGIQPIGSGAHWNCDDSDAQGRTAKQMAYDIGNAITGLGSNNVEVNSLPDFNVTMRSSADGQQLSSVFDGPGSVMQDAAKFTTFTFCSASNKYSNNCNDPTANYIAGKKPDDFKGKTTTQVTIHAAKGGQGIDTLVAQADNPNNGSGTTSGSHTGQVTCNGGSLGWLLCSAIDALQDLTKQVAGFAEPLLIIRLDNVPSLDAAQRNVTNVANVALIIAFFVMILSQSTSIGLSTYGIKKRALQFGLIVPLVQLAGPIVKFIADGSNVAGYGINGILLVTTQTTISDSMTNTTNQLLSTPLESVGIVLLVLFAFIPLIATAVGFYAALMARLILVYTLYVFFPLFLVGYLFNEKVASRGVSMLVKAAFAYFFFEAGFGIAILITTLLSNLPGLQNKIAAIVVLVVFLASLRKLIDWAIQLPSAISGGITGLREKAAQKGRERFDKTFLGRNLAQRKQSRENTRQKRFLHQASSGAGVKGRILKASNRMRNPLSEVSKEAQVDYLQQLQAARQEMQDKRIGTMKAAVSREGGLTYAAHLARMKKGESATQYAARTGTNFRPDQIEALDKRAELFKGQIGTTDFRKSAVLAAHELGADTGEIRDATADLVTSMQDDHMSAADINDVMGGLVGQSAKSGGIYSMSGAGINLKVAPSDPRFGKYSRYGLKSPDQVLRSADFGKFESGQFGDLSGAPRNAAGQIDWAAAATANEDYALGAEVDKVLRNAGDPAAQTAMLQRIAQARNSKAFGDLKRMADEAGLTAQLQQIIQGFS